MAGGRAAKVATTVIEIRTETETITGIAATKVAKSVMVVVSAVANQSRHP